MPNLAVVDMTGKEVGTVELSEAIFGIEPNEPAMHRMVVNYLANNRQGTQSALTRSEVSGGGRKPWKQKGTSSILATPIFIPASHSLKSLMVSDSIIKFCLRFYFIELVWVKFLSLL